MEQLEELQVKIDRLNEKIAELENKMSRSGQSAEQIKDKVTDEKLDKKNAKIDSDTMGLSQSENFSEINGLIKNKINTLWYVARLMLILELLFLFLMILSSFSVLYILKMNVKYFGNLDNQIEVGAVLSVLTVLFAFLYLSIILGTRNRLGNVQSNLKKLETLQSDIAASKETKVNVNQKLNEIINSN